MNATSKYSRADTGVQKATYIFLFLFATFLYSFSYTQIFLADCDSAWHVAAGDLIRQLEGVPSYDSWSFTTTNNAKWYNISWLYDVSISWILAHIGISSLIAINILLAALVSVGLAYLCFYRDASTLAVVTVCLLSIISIKTCVSLRPQQISLLYIVATLICLERFSKQTSKMIWCLPLISILWVNTHGSFLLILFLIGYYLLKALLQAKKHHIFILSTVFIVSCISTLCNPLTYEVYDAIWMTLGSNYSQFLVTEWSAANIYENPDIFLYLFLIFFLPIFSKQKPDILDCLLLILFGVLAYTSRRYGVILSVIATPILAGLLSDGYAIREKYKEIDLELKNLLSKFYLSSRILLVAILILFILPTNKFLFLKESILDVDVYPLEEIKYLEQNYSGTNILNEYCYGGLITYFSNAQIKTFIDSRIDTVYSEEVKKNYFTVFFFLENWESVLSKYKTNLAIFSNANTRARDELTNAGWNVVTIGPVATIYQKSNL